METGSADLAGTQRARAGKRRWPRTGTKAADQVSSRTWRNALGTKVRLHQSCPNTDRRWHCWPPALSHPQRTAGVLICLSVLRRNWRFSRFLWRGGQMHITRPELNAHPAGYPVFPTARPPPTVAPPPLTYKAFPAVPVCPTPEHNPKGSLEASAPLPWALSSVEALPPQASRSSSVHKPNRPRLVSSSEDGGQRSP